MMSKLFYVLVKKRNISLGHPRFIAGQDLGIETDGR